MAIRDHFKQAEKSSGKMVPELHPDPLPRNIEYLWGWFLDLHSSRGSNGAGPNPIGFPDIRFWAELSGERPSPWEVLMIRRLDQIYISVCAKRAAEKSNG